MIKEFLKRHKNFRHFLSDIFCYSLIWLPDKQYLEIFYYVLCGKKLNFNNARTFNEKLQWLKLYDRNPEYTVMADKYEVRNYVTSKIGAEYLIPLLGVWDNFEDINFNELPNQFVLKCTHDSGSVIICKDKANFELKKAKNEIECKLKINYYYKGREWQYKNIRPRIIAEKYIMDQSGYEVKDYRIMCFNGKAKLIMVDFDKYVKYRRNLYSINWEYIHASIGYPSDGKAIIDKPEKLDKMIEIAEVLSENIPHVRVDLYVAQDRIYFGEATFQHKSGTSYFSGNELEMEMGDWIELPDL